MIGVIITSIVGVAILIGIGFIVYAFFRLTTDWNNEIIAKEEALNQIAKDIKAIKKAIR